MEAIGVEWNIWMAHQDGTGKWGPPGNLRQHIASHWVFTARDAPRGPELLVEDRKEDLADAAAYLQTAEFVQGDPVVLPIDVRRITGENWVAKFHPGRSISWTGFGILTLEKQYGANPVMCQADISRYNGELLVYGCGFSTWRGLFRRLDNVSVYNRLREEVLLGVYDLLLSGVLEEVVYIELEEEDIDATSPNEASRLAEVDPPENASPVQEWAYTPYVAPEPASQVGEEEPKNLTSARLLERRLTRWRVLHALDRCGVKIDTSRNHPQLRYGDAVYHYIGSHQDRRDPTRNKRKLFEALRVLGISRSEFAKHLK